MREIKLVATSIKMSPKQFLALILFYMSYLFFGASVYFTLEQELETVERAEKLQKRLEINGTYYRRFSRPTAYHEIKSQTIIQLGKLN